MSKSKSPAHTVLSSTVSGSRRASSDVKIRWRSQPSHDDFYVECGLGALVIQEKSVATAVGDALHRCCSYSLEN